MKDNFSAEEPRDIRSEPFTFEELGIKQMNRIAELGHKAMNAAGLQQKYNLLGVEAAIVAFAAFLPTEIAKKSIVKYKKKLNRDWLDEPDNRAKFFSLLMEWFSLLVGDFYSVGNVVPAKAIGVDFE